MNDHADIGSTFKAEEGELPARLLLHACCGPCSLEPIRVLEERGVDVAIHYSNANIAPFEEYEHRLETIREFARENDIPFVEDSYDNDAWQKSAGAIGAAEAGSERRRARCRACYRQRLERTAAYAREGGFDAIGTTLSVSPYQYGDIIREELERAAAQAGIDAFFEDYSPLYAQATRRSKEAGMYRQNYCGCAFSDAEARYERAMRKAAREKEKLARAKARAAEEEKLEARRLERAAYDEKQARKHAILKAMRAERSIEGGRRDER